MEYLILIAMFVLSTIVAYWIMQKEMSILTKIFTNAFILCFSGAAMIVTGFKETSFLLYVLLLSTTLLGILMRIITPICLNFLGRIVAKIQKEPYTEQSYDDIMHSGHKMFFCVLTFTTLKVFLYVALIASFFSSEIYL